MNLYAILAIACALAMDAFAVAIATGVFAHALTRKQVARMAVAFGGFQFLMTILGWYAGLSVRDMIEDWDHWVAFGLLALIASAMIKESFHCRQHDRPPRGDPTKGVALLLLSLATSLDAFAVGLSFSLLFINIWTAAAIIGVVCALITVLGLYLGRTLRKASTIACHAEFIGGLVLLGIGVNILYEHGVF